MKLSKLWLREWVDVSLSEQELASQLTMAGLEVDAVNPVAGVFDHVIVAEVLNTKPHPNADKLTLCEVNANTNKPLQIVCGAANVRPGLKVALAMVGASLPGGFTIKESKLRGELSQGMLCSVSELGMEEHSEGIMELEDDAPVGMDLRTYLALDDYLFDIDLTPNRADCFSVLGLAREVAVLNQLPLLVKETPAMTPSIDDVLPIHIKEPDACARYCGRVIRNLNPEANTPLWMKERLRRSGLRTVHPVVDVLNYVMIELGQPMHAFDLDAIHEEINVRFSTPNERLTLLDGQELCFNEQVVLIADKNKPLAIAGVMGGADSAVQQQTTDIFLESAFFNPVVIAGVARKFGLFSDSSQRFERGVDPELQIKALERATALILELAGGDAGPIIALSEEKYLPQMVCCSFDTDKVKKLTGLSISIELMKNFLEGLGIRVTQERDQVLEVIIPSYRFDIHQDEDLVEEMIRLYGYNKLHAEPMRTVVQAGVTCGNEAISKLLAHWFSTRGYCETISYSFVDPELQQELYPHQKVMTLLNPISSELSQMRAGMWPGLIASLIYNVHRQRNAVKLFELGVAFEVMQQQLVERPCIAGLLMGEQGATNWSESTRFYDFFDLKGDLQSLFASFKLRQVEFVPMEHDALHPGQSAQIQVRGNPSGWIGTLHPRIADALEFHHDVVLFEIDLKAFMEIESPRYRPISRYPQIRRDLSFLVADDVHVMQIESTVRSVIQENWLKSFDVFDVYTGEGIPQGKKSLAISILLQDESRTLIDAEINSLIDAIINMLEDKFSIILRD